MPSDPFSTTYEGAFKAGTSLGTGIQSASKDITAGLVEKKKRDEAFKLLKQFGMIDTKTEEPSLEELTKGAQEYAKSQGSELAINTGDNPEQAKQNIMGIYKALGIPVPKGKTKTTLNLAPGTKYDPMKGDVEFSNPKSLLSPYGMENIPEGMEVTGYDQKGQPMIRKIAPESVAEKKFKVEEEERKTAASKKSELVLNSANDTLKTIAEIEKDAGNFGLLGGFPSIPGTPRVNWEANIDKLLSGKVLDTIMALKDASKTGATGFGQLNLKELETLQKASTALKRTSSQKDAQRYLNDMKVSMNKIIEGNGGYVNMAPGVNADGTPRHGIRKTAQGPNGETMYWEPGMKEWQVQTNQ